MEKVMFILHTYSVGGAERRCVHIANYLASRGVKVKILLLDVDKMYDCKRNVKGLEIDINLVDSPVKIDIPVSDLVEVVYLLHEGETLPLNNKIKYALYDRNDTPQKNSDYYITEDDTNQKITAKKQLEQLQQLYINRIYQYVKNFPDYKIVSWMTFCNIATAIALNDLPNDFAFVECTSPAVEFSKDSAFNYLKEKFYPRANAAFFQTEEMKDFYTFLPKLKRYVIPNPILDNLPNCFNSERKKVIVNFCRVEKAKKLELLIETFSLLHKKHPDYRLHIYGDGSQKEMLIQLTKQKNLEKSVTFFEFTSDIHQKVMDAAVFVSTSEREGISNSMIEAMAIGLPVVCTDCHGGGARAMIKNGENGFLVPMNDKNALLNAILKVIESPDLSRRFSENAVKIKEQLSVSNIGKMWETALKESWTN